MQPGQFAAGSGLESIHQRCQGAQDGDFRVGLGGVEKFAARGQHGAHGTHALLQGWQVVQVGTQRVAAVAPKFVDGSGDTRGKAHGRAPQKGLGRVV
ncbi:hypothetical protein D9M68_746180 [compost metagenome]